MLYESKMKLILQSWIGRNSEGNLGLAEEILVSRFVTKTIQYS